MKATYRTIEVLTRRKIVNATLKAMTAICGFSNGTLRRPSELASSVLRDGRYLIQAINEDGEILYNDGWFIVEVTDSHLYVDITSFAYKEIFGVQALNASEKEAIFQLCGVWAVALALWCIWFICC